MEALVRFVRFLSWLGGVSATLLILAAIVIVCQAIFVRDVLGESAFWQTEFVTFSLIAATFLGAPYVLMTKGHVNVDLVPLLLRPRARFVLALFAASVGLLFCLIVFLSSLDWWYTAFAAGRVTSSMWRARLWIPYLAVPVGMALLCLQYLVDLWALASGRERPFGLK